LEADETASFSEAGPVLPPPMTLTPSTETVQHMDIRQPKPRIFGGFELFPIGPVFD
jgi:hypothetical protein